MNMKKMPLILFDVDGTLTEARQPIKKRMLLALHHLAKECEIGFLTGSGMDYIKEQLWPALNDKVIRENCHLLPCNGTEYAVPAGEDTLDLSFTPISKEVMQKEVGTETQYELLRYICKLQSDLLKEHPSLPVTGHFIQNRGSMINWSPIGRNGDNKERETFITMDKTFKIRDSYLDALREHTNNVKITAKLGGDTSFDIYPNGWDKTFALSHFDKQHWDFWFVGDRCEETGNDYEIYNLLKPLNRALNTTGPGETIEYIDWYILPEVRKK